MKKFPFLFFVLLSVTAFPQNMSYAHYVINKLASDAFKGRGFVDNGDKIAANFIQSQLDSLKVKSFNGNYFQPFILSVNTFPDKLFLAIDGKELIPGKDFLMDMNSGSVKGQFTIKTIYLSKIGTDMPKHLSSVFVLLIDDIANKESANLIRTIIYSNTLHAKGYILIEDMLVNEPAAKVIKHTILKIQKDAFALPCKEITIKAKNKFLKNYQTQNIAGYLPGEVDSFIVFTAHYDHLGKMGNRATFYGANDNASGVTMVLNLADYFAHHKPHYSIGFMFFSGEEEGLLGSFYAANHPVLDLKKIKFLLNLDMVGTGEEGIKIVNSTVFKNEMALLEQINSEKHFLVKIAKRGEAANSDHYPFYAKGVPSFFIYTLGGSQQYHNIYDKPDQLSLFAFENLEKLLILFEERY